MQLKDKDIMKLLLFIMVCVLGYLITWTLVVLDFPKQGYLPLVKIIKVDENKIFKVCRVKWWDYFIETSTIFRIN